jgi:hypothetical protein
LISSGIKDDIALLSDGAFMVELTHNVASNGMVGFVTDLARVVQDNVTSGNSAAGFMLVPGANKDTAFRRNSAIGNGGPGAIVAFSPRAPSSLSTQNNFIGNDRRRPKLDLKNLLVPPALQSPDITEGPSAHSDLDFGPSAHCGVLNVGPLVDVYPTLPPPLPITTVQAGNNFWGSVNGPQANGAGDSAGGACNQNGGATVASSFASAPFPIIPIP